MKPVFVALFAGLIGCAFLQPVSAAEGAELAYKVLWSFGNGTDGRYPYASLIDVNGTLYGTTYSGGGSGCGGDGCGTVFSLDPDTGAEKVLHSFCSQKNCRDGASPEAGLFNANGTLYGTTAAGGRNTSCGYNYVCGTVFALDPNTGAEKVRYSFCTYPICADGADPVASLVAVKGTLYGTTLGGGTGCWPFGCGTVFSLDPDKRAEKVLYSFGNDAFPYAGLIAVNGILYGTTVGGGNEGCHTFTTTCGTVFSFDLSTGSETTLYSFCNRQNCTDGANPTAGLIAVKGKLYGTTYDGGATEGTIYSVDPSKGAEKVVYAFCQHQDCSDGAFPRAGVIDMKGTLYGTTYAGGGTGCGTVFSLDLSTGTETVLHSFGDAGDGQGPLASLIAVNGKLYGTTESGGAYGHGTEFVLKKKL